MSSLDKRIPAIVLSFDQNRVFADQMILTYGRVWPTNPLQFIVPYQADRTLDSRIDSSTVLFVKTKPGIRDTVLELLAPFDDESFVYWAIDDKFPVRLHVETLSLAFQSLVASPSRVDIDGLLFTRARSLISSPGIERRISSVFGVPAYRVHVNNQFWLHQLVKVRRLRNFFMDMPDIQQAKDMDGLVSKMGSPASLFVSRKNALVLGESTSRGVPTVEWRRAANRWGLESVAVGVGAPTVRTIGKLTPGEKKRKFVHDMRGLIGGSR